jgi:DNA-binding transcriptional ArsR family regulator
MPISMEDVLDTSKTDLFQFDLAPAHNASHSLFNLLLEEKLSGLPDWVSTTNKAMGAKLREENQLVMEGFHGLASPHTDWPSFMDFVDDLAARDAKELPGELLRHYTLKRTPRQAVDSAKVLASPENYLNFLYECYPPDHINEKIERRAFEYMLKPAALQDLIVGHLTRMWKQYLQPEWERVLPMLQSSVDAFREVSVGNRDRLDAIRWVTGNPMQDAWWLEKVKDVNRIVFVPSAHVGPYLGRIHGEDTLWVIFGARLPQGAGLDAPDLSRAEIVVRMNALADDDRLRILRLLAEHGELKSPEIIKQLSLSQSAASRHLMQLSATGFISERRSNGAKAYQVNQTRFADTFEGLDVYLRVTK